MRPFCTFAATSFALALMSVVATAQTGPFAGPNINMICGYGSDFTKCDPSLGKQNEPTISVSTRNPNTLIAGANDYRGASVAGGDAWVSVIKSFDGGLTWKSALHPGCPEAGMCTGNSVLQGFQAASDPTVRCGPNGLCFFTGIAFNRGGLGVVWVSRWIDDNNPSKINDDTVRYIETTILDNNTSGQIQDKPWVAVDKPRAGSPTITIPGSPAESFPYGNVYVVYSTFVGSNNSSQIRLVTSTDGGTTWSKPAKVSGSSGLVQGATVAVDPVTGTVVIAWRQFQNPQQPDAIMTVKSTDKGRTFTTPIQVAAITPFDQPQSGGAIRITTFPSLAISVDPAGVRPSRANLVWSDRSGPTGVDGLKDARIVISTASLDNTTSWTAPVMIDSARSSTDPPNPANPGTSLGTMRGHQFFPALAYANGMLTVLYNDSRDDGTYGQLQCPPNATCTRTSDLKETRVANTDLAAGCFNNVFNGYLMDVVPPGVPLCNGGALKRRHTIDVRAAQAIPDFSTTLLTFAPTRVSQFTFGLKSGTLGNAQQQRFNPINLPIFSQYTLPFLGDYLDIAALSFVPNAQGQWDFTNSAAGNNSPVFYGTWTTNQGVTLKCPGGPGSQNQDVYVARISPGLAVTTRHNFRPLGPPAPAAPAQRAFAFNVQNMTNVTKCIQITAANPASGKASFLQNGTLNSVNAQIWRKSTISRTVYVSSSSPADQVLISVIDTGTNIGTVSNPVCVASSPALLSTVLLNPDSTNPISATDTTPTDQITLNVTPSTVTTINSSSSITNQNINLDLVNLDLVNTDLVNTDLVNTDLVNTDLVNLDLVNTDLVNLDLVNTDLVNTDLVNTDLVNTDLVNTDLVNTDLVNGAIQDVTTQVSNTGTTDTSTNLKLLQQSATQCQPAGSLKCQLIVTRLTVRPVVTPSCLVKQFVENQLVGRFSYPNFVTATSSTDPTAENALQSVDQTTPDVANATLAVAAGERVTLTLRMVDPDKSHFCGQPFAQAPPNCIDPPNAVKHVPVAKNATTGVVVVPLVETLMNLPNGIYQKAYNVTLKVIGAPMNQTTWTLINGSLPQGLTLSTNGVISGSPKATGIFFITIQVASLGQTSTQKLSLTVTKVNGTF